MITDDEVQRLIDRLVKEAPPLTMEQRLRLAVLLAAPIPQAEPPATKAGTPPMVLTVDEAAEIMRTSRTKVYELIRSGRLPSMRIGRSRRIRRSDLVLWIERQK